MSFLLFLLFIAQALAIYIPNVFLSLAEATPAWIRPEYDITNPITNPDHDKLGAVASENSICSSIGINLLKVGGNAADALVGTVLCVGTIGMYHSGPGGGGFMLVRDSDGNYEDIDFRETAPAAAFTDMYKDNVNGSIYTGLASGVPGEMRALGYVHEKYGLLPWNMVVMPAVRLARDGFIVNEDLVRYMDSAISGVGNFLVDDPAWAVDFAPNGKLVEVNDTITRKRYADTLETVAQYGPSAFYEGPIAEATIRAIQAANGTMTLDDLKDYSLVIREPIATQYGDFKLYTNSLPSSGPVALSVMNIMSGYLNEDVNLNLTTHRLTEAFRFAYGQRSEMGDPDFVEGELEYQSEVLTAATAADIRAKISDAHTLNISAYDPSGFEVLETPGTSAVVVSDASGMAISLTTTINLLFGSKVIVPETGIIMNDEMNDFSIPGKSNVFGYLPSPNNFIKPGKRPLSSITPVIVEHADNGSLYYVVAAAGGSRIPTATLQNLWHVLDHGMSAPEALAQPRLHDQLIPNNCFFEFDYGNDTIDFMRERGHNISIIELGAWISTVQSLRLLPNGTFEAAGEPRQVNSGGLVA